MKINHFLKDLAARLSESMPNNLHSFKKDIEKNFHGVLMSAFAKLDLVTREEFDAQSKVLLRTRKKLESLEIELKKLEKKPQSREK